MIQAIRRSRVSNHSLLRAVSASIVLALWVFISSCANLAKVSDQTIPKMILPLADADFNGLVGRLQPLMSFQALRSSRVQIRFIDDESSERYRTADAVLALKRPDNIYLKVQIPVTGSKVAEMVSDTEQFKVAIYRDPYKRFLIGTNNADYRRWREQLGRDKQSALTNARPFHFTDAMMIRSLHIGEARFVYTLEEALIEEPDTSKGAKKGARLLRSFYVISEAELSSTEQGSARARRRFWFDRTDPQTRLARQQVFDERGLIATEVHYSKYTKLGAANAEWPSVIFMMRPRDNYSVQLTFSDLEFNPNLPATAFELKNTEGLPETDLDKTTGTRDSKF